MDFVATWLGARKNLLKNQQLRPHFSPLTSILFPCAPQKALPIIPKPSQNQLTSLYHALADSNHTQITLSPTSNCMQQRTDLTLQPYQNQQKHLPTLSKRAHAHTSARNRISRHLVHLTLRRSAAPHNTTKHSAAAALSH